MKHFLPFTMTLMVIQSCVVPPTPLDSGVSLNLVNERKRSVSNIEYDLSFLIPESKLEMITANETMRFHCAEIDNLALDFKESSLNLKQMSVNGNPIDPSVINEHIVIPKKYLQEENVVEIEFIAGNLSLNRNEDYLYTLLVPDRARTVFPLMDQPNLKAKWQLSLDIPAAWEAVANGPVISVEVADNRKKISFEQTRPISSYLFAFAAGKFQRMSNPEGDMTMYYRETDTLKIQRNAPEIFSLHRKALDWLETYTGIKYPFQKFDFALIPTFQYGGMEHPGSIFYRERSLMLDESASINQELRRASLIAHETAHMWFGDLVTMDWFNDVWLKEVFANFMAAKIVNPSFPEIDHDLRFLLAHYPAAYAVDRSEGTHPIQQPLDNLQDAGSLYGAIIYQKAPVVMRNLESIIGETQFQKGIQTYLNNFSFSNATWDDLIGILSKYSDLDLNQWNRDWVKKSGMPEISIQISDRMLDFDLVNSHDNQIWPQQITLSLDQDRESFMLTEKSQIEVDDRKISINSNGRAYGYLNFSPDLQKYQNDDLSHPDDLIRASSWMTLWEAFLHKKILPQEIYQCLLMALPSEKNPLILDYLSDILQTTYWHFMTDQRPQIQKEIESILFKGMTQETDESLQRIFYNAYSSITLSEVGIQNLQKIWAGNLPAFQLPLSENDKIRLALQLAVRNTPDVQKILKDQMDLTRNPDNKKRLEFLMPALSSDQGVRDHFFESLLLEENREQEPWVSEALSYLHHPLRARQSEKYILPSLQILPEIKKTGDIFFPKAWLDATLSGHSSTQAAKIVTDFLKDHPEIAPDLRNKILQSADILFRSTEFND
ncbi:MAG: hypothetical protein KDC53_08175 [Saprospiraceae bacterium]|nr:hypothetical protein [Saprospiraceae bacterium]